MSLAAFDRCFALHQARAPFFNECALVIQSTASEQAKKARPHAAYLAGSFVPNCEHLLRIEDIIKITRLCKTTIYKLIKDGCFPRPSKIGRNSVWASSVVAAWVSQFANGEQK